MLGVAIEPERRGDEQRLADTLHKLTAEDPCVRIEHHAAVNETVLYGMGEFHLRVAARAHGRALRVHVKTHPAEHPVPRDRHATAEGHCRTRSRPAAPGSSARCICVSRRSARRRFEFVDDVVAARSPGSTSRRWRRVCARCWPKARSPAFRSRTCGVTVYDGKHHSVDSKEVAFVSAGRKAFLDALEKAAPIVLEPIMRLEITAPASAIGDITGDLATKRARINGNSSLPGQRSVLMAFVPLAEVSEYQSRLKALTGGRVPTPWS